MTVTEAEVLASWKLFFHDGTNWKDLKKNISLAEFKAISDRARFLFQIFAVNRKNLLQADCKLPPPCVL